MKTSYYSKTHRNTNEVIRVKRKGLARPATLDGKSEVPGEQFPSGVQKEFTTRKRRGRRYGHK
jgi:hypothetical protein